IQVRLFLQSCCRDRIFRSLSNIMADGLYTDETDVELPAVVPPVDQSGVRSSCKPPTSVAMSKSPPVVQSSPQPSLSAPTAVSNVASPTTLRSPTKPLISQTPHAAPVSPTMVSRSQPSVAVPPSPPAPAAFAKASQSVSTVSPKPASPVPVLYAVGTTKVNQPVSTVPPKPASPAPTLHAVTSPKTSQPASTISPKPASPAPILYAVGTAKVNRPVSTVAPKPASSAPTLRAVTGPKTSQPASTAPHKPMSPTPILNASPKTAPVSPKSPIVQRTTKASFSTMSEESYTDETDVEMPISALPISPPQVHDIVTPQIHTVGKNVINVPNAPTSMPAASSQNQHPLKCREISTVSIPQTSSPSRKPTSPNVAEPPKDMPSVAEPPTMKSPKASRSKDDKFSGSNGGGFIEEFSFFSGGFAVPRRTVSEEYVLERDNEKSSAEKSK
uniref:Uncharacterized protein n=2 Tax=Parascaris univalens TaxID=6257 RepID=A0A915AR96_PARUN